MKVVAVIQARTGSTRLPGKVLMDIAGEPMLARVVNRVSRASAPDTLVVATTTRPADDAVAEICAERGLACFRGSEDDVLDRYYRAAAAHGADVVIRITSDCPFIDPGIVDRVAETLGSDGTTDYASNVLPPRTFPRGLDVEAVTFDALERAWREDENPEWREHVTPYLRRHPESFVLRGVVNEEDLSGLRWTVDTAEDLRFARGVYEHFGHDGFSWREVLELIERRPELAAINRHVPQRQVSEA